MPDTPEDKQEEIGLDDILEALEGKTATEVAQFFADAGVKLQAEAVWFTPICVRCGAIKHEMILYSENVSTAERESGDIVENMVLCSDCAAKRLGYEAGDLGASADGVKLWRERNLAVQEIFYDLPEDRPMIGVCHYGFRPSGGTPDHDYCLRHDDWEAAVKGLPYAPGDEPPKKKRVKAVEEPQEEENASAGESQSEPVRKRVRV